ncbi:MAG: DUF3299 domain-containing protein [Lautropia sp.]
MLSIVPLLVLARLDADTRAALWSLLQATGDVGAVSGGSSAYRDLAWSDLAAQEPRDPAVAGAAASPATGGLVGLVGHDGAIETDGLDRIDALRDGDPRATELLARLQAQQRRSAIDPSLNDQDVRIAGFVVPLSAPKGKMHAFLLVPFFGACIHVPPPPANQLVHVRSDKPIIGLRTMTPVYVSGRLRTQATQSPQGDAGYSLDLAEIAIRADPQVPIPTR